MIKFTKLTLKNFQSFGNTDEEINLDADSLSLVLGYNKDKDCPDNKGNRNGVGKSAIVNALNFAIYGISIDNKIKKSNLINKTNKRVS